MHTLALPLVVLPLVLAATAHNHGGGGGGGSQGSSSSSSGSQMMTPYLHTATGDALFFEGWTPTSSGAVAGASVGLFFLALFERWVHAMAASAARSWARSAQIQHANALNAAAAAGGPANTRRARTALPFIWTHDVPRGVIHAVDRALGYALMLAVMTFQVGYIIAIIVGAGVGEMLFGRYAHGGAAQTH